MRTLIRTSLILMLASAPMVGITVSGCATGGGATGKATTKVELDNTVWKLPMYLGRLDGRSVRFHKSGPDTYIAKLENKGLSLRDVAGLDETVQIFSLEPTSSMNEYTGYYKDIQPMGLPQNKEVQVTVFNEDEIRTSLDQTWTRVRD